MKIAVIELKNYLCRPWDFKMKLRKKIEKKVKKKAKKGILEKLGLRKPKPEMLEQQE